MKGTKTRWFIVTDWNISNTKEEYEKIIAKGQIRFIAYGQEVCPKSGKKHHQMFVYFHNLKTKGKLSLNKIGKMFGDVHANVLPMEGNVLQNEAYCSKDGIYTEVGDKPTQGKRGDLDETKRSILEDGLSVDEIAVADPHMFHMYGRTLERLEAISLRNKFRNWRTEGVWYWGPTGTGKSHRAFTDFHPSTHYIKNLNEDFWNGYKGQPIVIFNEFRGQIPFSELLDLVDKWPKTVKWKCSEGVPFLARKLIVTSCKEPSDIYYNILSEEESIEQLNRRFKIIKCDQKYSKGNNKTFEPNQEKTFL